MRSRDQKGSNMRTHRPHPRPELSATRSAFAALLLLLSALFQCSQQQASAQMQSTAPAPTQSVAPAANPPSPTYSQRTYKKPADPELKSRLEPLEYAVTQRGATEPAFQNRYFK